MDDGHTFISDTVFFQGSANLGLVADQKELRDFLIGLQGKLGSGNHNAAAMVTAHDIHCNLHKRNMRRNNSAKRPFNRRSSQSFYRDNLTAFVVTTSGTDPVGYVRGSTLRTRA